MESGDVTLTGSVPIGAMKQLIEQCASNIEGLKSVKNEIRVSSEDASAMGSE